LAPPARFFPLLHIAAAGRRSPRFEVSVGRHTVDILATGVAVDDVWCRRVRRLDEEARLVELEHGRQLAGGVVLNRDEPAVSRAAEQPNLFDRHPPIVLRQAPAWLLGSDHPLSPLDAFPDGVTGPGVSCDAARIEDCGVVSLAHPGVLALFPDPGGPAAVGRQDRGLAHHRPTRPAGDELRKVLRHPIERTFSQVGGCLGYCAGVNAGRGQSDLLPARS
jgi:hypothetical protein